MLIKPVYNVNKITNKKTLKRGGLVCATHNVNKQIKIRWDQGMEICIRQIAYR